MCAKSLRWLLAGALIFTVACGSEDDPDPTTTGTPDDTGDDPPPPDPPPTTFGGDRPAELRVPSTYDGETPLPLLVALHGYSEIPEYWGRHPVFDTFAEDQGIFYIAPLGTLNEDTDRYFWNGTDACCDDGRNIDDSSYLIGLIDEIAEHYAIDPSAVFLLGHSNGAFMSYRMACEHADRIAGIAAVAGVTFEDREACQPSEPVNILHIHGEADPTIVYDGGALGTEENPIEYPGALETVEIWADYNGCTGELSELQAERINLVGPDDPEAPNETGIQTYGDCPSSGAVELWTTDLGGHMPLFLPQAQGLIADWLLSHTK